MVAALTLPSVIQKHKEKVTVSKVKKFYSTINQALLMAIKDNGYLDEWAVPDGAKRESIEKFMEYLKPYLLISEDCGTNSGCLDYKSKVKKFDGTVYKNYDTDPIYYKIILNDGSYIWLRSSLSQYCKSLDVNIADTCGLVFTDINGSKEPNTFGKDIFCFYILKNRLTTIPVDWSNFQNLNANNKGLAAGTYILIFGNMDYLH